MSVLTLPEPPGWRNGQRRFGWPIVGLLVITAWATFHGVQAALRGHFLTTLVLVGLIAPFWIMLVALAWVSLGRTVARAGVDSAGTMLRPDIRMGILVALAGVFLIPAALLFVIFVPRGAIDLPMSRGMQIFSPIAMACVVVIAVGGALVVIRRQGVGFLRLSLSGLENTNTKIPTFLAWDDILAVKDSTKKPTRRALVLCLTDGREEIVDGLDWYVPGGVGLYWMIRHYWLHPDDRTELVDGRALERLKDGRFDVDHTDDSNT